MRGPTDEGMLVARTIGKKAVRTATEAVQPDLLLGETVELVVWAQVKTSGDGNAGNIAASAAISAVLMPLLGTAGATLQRRAVVFAIVTDRRLLFIESGENRSGSSNRIPIPGLIAEMPRSEVRAVTSRGGVGGVGVTVVARSDPSIEIVKLVFGFAIKTDGEAFAAALA